MGMTCGFCGQWFEYTHTCPRLNPLPSNIPTTYPATTSTYTFTDWSGLYLRIALALERIATALEPKMKPTKPKPDKHGTIKTLVKPRRG